MASGGAGGMWKRRRFFSFQRGKYGATTMVYPDRRLPRWVMTIVLVLLAILGLYFLLWHKDPLPGNHEAIGLGDAHAVHDVIGIVLLATASLTWYFLRHRARAAA